MMKTPYSLFSVLILDVLVISTSACTKENQAEASKQPNSQLNFRCGTAENQSQSVPATIVENPDREKPLTVIYYDPKNNYFGDKWTPQAHCEEVSKRF